MENLFLAWREFRRGKRKKLDVQEFEFNLENNLFQFHQELKNKTYRHSQYTSFFVCDPKLRKIHKACVHDRVLHHAVFRILYPIFDRGFIFDSYSCRVGKGTHRAVKRLEKFCSKLSRNNTRNIFALKCDIRKFFDSIDQDILLEIIKKKIKDKNTIWLIERIIRSFQTRERKGLPLGNVTSQLFANIYLDELDQFAKHILREKYYLRYCDDFMVMGESEDHLTRLISPIGGFLKETLQLDLHPEKIHIRKFHQGIDFLGYVILPHHIVLRTKTKRRMFKKIRKNFEDLQSGLFSEKSFNQSLQSYLGILSHANAFCLSQEIKIIFLE